MKLLTAKSIPANYNWYLGVLLVATVLSISACRSKKVAKDHKTLPENKTTAETKTGLAFLKQLESQVTDFRTVAFRGKARYQSAEDNQTVQYKLHLEKDKRIWVSVSMLGIEGARMLISKDSVKILDRINREYRIVDFNYLSKEAQMPVNFNILQKVLLADPPITAQNTKILSQSAELVRLSSQNGEQQIELDVNPTWLKLLGLRADNPKTKQKASMSFERFQEIEGKKLPFLVQMRAESIQLSLEHQKVVFNPEDITFNFSIPNGYSKAD